VRQCRDDPTLDGWQQFGQAFIHRPTLLSPRPFGDIPNLYSHTDDGLATIHFRRPRRWHIERLADPEVGSHGLMSPKPKDRARACIDSSERRITAACKDVCALLGISYTGRHYFSAGHLGRLKSLLTQETAPGAALANDVRVHMMKEESLPRGFINLSMRRSRFDVVVIRRSCFLRSTPEISRRYREREQEGQESAQNVTEEKEKKARSKRTGQFYTENMKSRTRLGSGGTTYTNPFVRSPLRYCRRLKIKSRTTRRETRWQHQARGVLGRIRGWCSWQGISRQPSEVAGRVVDQTPAQSRQNRTFSHNSKTRSGRRGVSLEKGQTPICSVRWYMRGR